MDLLPRLCTVLCVLQLLLVMTHGANHNHPPSSKLTATNTDHISHQEDLIRDCSDLDDGLPSGVYDIRPDLLTPTPVYCDMGDGKGWTVFQKRADVSPRQDFWKDWESYKWGLGSLEGEFWWGLHHIWKLTSQLDRVYELRVDLWDWAGQTRHAVYQDFTVAAEEDGYRLDFTGYAGDAGDSLAYHNGMKFSTIDRDNDLSSSSCASYNKGAWWYNSCYESNLNGLYNSTGASDIIEWEAWRHDYNLKATTMKIRPSEEL